MNIAIIPARGGSKRIPQKNIKLFYGKPIIAWSIEAAQKSQCFDSIIVSTDDSKIAEIAKAYGAETPFMRPEELSGDFITTRPVVNHAINWLVANRTKPDYVCTIYPTAPFVTAEDLKESFEKVALSKAQFIFTMTAYPFPIQRSVKLTTDGKIEMCFPEYRDTRSQDLEEIYHDAGQFYWGKTDAFLENLPTFSEYAIPYLIPRTRAQDIDTLEDWQIAEAMFASIIKNENNHSR
jgi:N-acylneuraminate cytidylyltransferase